MTKGQLYILGGGYTFEIKKVHDGYIIIRKGTDKHSHYAHRSGAILTLKFIQKRIMPTNGYFRTAIQRLLTQEELSMFKYPPTQRYVNTR